MNAGYSPSTWMRNRGTLIPTPDSSYDWRNFGEHVTRNKATDYRTGQEFHTDFAVAYNFNPVTVGLNGYYYKQMTDDKQNGVSVGDDGYKGETLALGPVVRYQAGKVPISFQYQHEMFAHNRPQGDNFWLKAAFRF